MRIPEPQNQPDSISCVPTATSMAVDGSTGGAKKPSVRSLRASVNDFSGGMDYLQMTAATSKTAGVKSSAVFGTPTGNVVATVEAGHFVVVSIDTNITAPYPDVRTYYFRGGHSILLVANHYSVWPAGDVCACERHTAVRHGEFTYKDPGTSKGFHQISASLLFRAMLARADNGGCNILVLPDVTGVKRKAIETGYVRSKPSNSTTSRKLRRLVIGQAYAIAQPISGSDYRRNDGTTSNGWYGLTGGGFVRADHLGVTNQ